MIATDCQVALFSTEFWLETYEELVIKPLVSEMILRGALRTLVGKILYAFGVFHTKNG